MAARRNSKAAKLVCRIQDLRSNVDKLAQSLRDEQAALDEALDELVTLIEDETDKADKPAPRKPSPRKPKADAQKADSPWVKGCTFTYVKADGSESQHRIIRTEGDHAIARALASGQERRWLLTTLAAMLQTKNVIVKAK